MGISRYIFAVSPDEVRFEVRGFRGGTPEVRAHIDQVGTSFLAGYHAALEERRLANLVPRLEQTALAYRGFTYEGAAMGLALLDALTPWRRNRLRRFLDGAGDAHVYMAHVGAGWALARLPFGGHGILSRLDPLLRWLALDGYGFHQGYFHWPQAVECRAVPRGLRGYARRAFDQGLGRSLWFVEGADVERIPATIGRFPALRRSDLWAGVGLACTYAGGVERGDLEALARAGGGYGVELAQGAAFAAKARLRAGNAEPHVGLACQVLCGRSAEEAAAVTDRALEGLPPDGEEPAYEVWRRRIQDMLREPVAERVVA